MPTVLCLGGTGQFGLPTARYLADDPAVDRVIVAGRDLERARAAAATLGPKGAARQVDADDDASLAAAMAGVSVVASTLWEAEGRAARVARAAVAAGAHYCDLNDELQSPELAAAARASGLTIMTAVGFSPGVIDIGERHLLEAFDEAQALVSVMHWTQVLDAWADLFDAYVALPGQRKRGPLGRRLHATLTAPVRDPASVAAVLRDACVVPFWLTMAGDPGAWLATLPDLRDGAWVEVDAATEGLDLSLLVDAPRRERPIVATARAERWPGVRRITAYVSGLGPAFDDAVRAGARRVADGGDLAAEVATLEAAMDRDPLAYLRPADEVAALPAAATVGFGRHGGRTARASVHLPLALMEPDRFLSITAASLAVTVRYLLDGTITVRGATRMRQAVRDAERFGSDYLALLPGLPEGTTLFTRRVAA